jgi:hypothetical protein
VTIIDGTNSPNTLTVKVGDGNLTFSEKRNIEYKRDRGLLDTTRLGDQEPMDVKLEFNWIFLKGDTGDYTANPNVTDISMRDALTKSGGASTWTSSDTHDPCAPYAITIQILYTPCVGKTETITLKDYRYESLDYDAKAGTVSTSGKCNIMTPTLVRT